MGRFRSVLEDMRGRTARNERASAKHILEDDLQEYEKRSVGWW